MDKTTRVVYCGTEDSFFKKLAKYAVSFSLEARGVSLQASPQDFARTRKAAVLVLSIKNEFDLKQKEWLSRNDASVPIIVVCRNGSVETAILALQYGVFDYFCLSQGCEVVARRINDALHGNDPRNIKRPMHRAEQILVGTDPQILKLNEDALALAGKNTPVAISGESGTGKERLARAICQLTDNDLPFFRLDCRHLLQISRYDGLEVQELVRIYLDPIQKKHQAAALLLSHLEYLQPQQQAALLEHWHRSQVRLFVSYQERSGALFSEDITRHASPLKIPALRQRKQDIPLLSAYFLEKHTQKLKMPHRSLAEETLQLMAEYSWPGNVQELKNLIEKMILVESSLIIGPDIWKVCNAYGTRLNLDGANQFSELLESILESGQTQWKNGSLYDGFMQRMEKMLIELVLPKVDHNQALAAKVLGISRNTLRQRLKSA